MKMTSLKQMCEIVDKFVSDGTSPEFESSVEFWQKLNNDTSAAQMYTECLIYKYIALTYGLGQRPLFTTLSQIKNIATPNSPSANTPGISLSPDTTPGSSPRGSLTSSGSSSKLKRSSGSYDAKAPDSKGTPKRKYNIVRRKSEDSKKASKKSELDTGMENSLRRKSNKASAKAANNVEIPSETEQVDESLQHALDNVLLSLTYMSKMCDLSEWDFSKLREVFLTWNKARGWEQSASDYEYAVMKRFSMCPPNNARDIEQNARVIGDILGSVKKDLGEIAILKNRKVGESIKYWEVRHKILTRPEEAISVVKCLILVAKKVLEEGDESKILPLLHIFCETIIMCPHAPLELLQECYSTFEMFYVWPNFVARPVKEVLDMIQLEMKCPGHFFRMIFFQDNEMPMAQHLKARMPTSETHVFVDEDIPDTAALSEAFGKLCESCSSTSKLSDETGKLRYIISHIFESVFGSECCDLATLDMALQACPEDEMSEMCYEALALMERASTMETHAEAQHFLRTELETFSEKLVDFVEVENEKDVNDDEEETNKNSLSVRPLSTRRVSVLFENYRMRDPSSPSHSRLKSGELGVPSAQRNNSYLRRTSSGTLDNVKGTKKTSMRSQSRSTIPAELIGSKVNMNTFSHTDLSETIFDLVRRTAKKFVQEKKKGVKHSFKRKRNSSHFDSQDALRDSGVIDDDYSGTSGENQGLSRANTLPTSAKNLASAVRHLRIEEGEEEKTPVVKMRPRKEKLKLSTSSSTDDQEPENTFLKMVEAEDSDSFWKEFSEHGFSSNENLAMEDLLKSMSLNERKSFLLEKGAKMDSPEEKDPEPPKSPSTESPSSPDNEIQINIESTSSETAATVQSISQTDLTEHKPVLRRDLIPSENKRLNRMSQFRMRFVRHRRKTSKKSKSPASGQDQQQDKVSSAESLSSVSSTPSSTTSEESNDQPTPRSRTTSDPIYRKRRRSRWNRGDTLSSSPLVSKNRRDTLSIEVTPRSPFNLSVRSLPSRERVSLFASDTFVEGRVVSPLPEDDATKDCDQCRTSKESFLHPPNSPNDKGLEGEENLASPLKNLSFQLGDDDDDARRRIDSGIGPDNTKSPSRRRTLSSTNNTYEQEDLGVAGVKFALKETIRASRRSRMSIGDFEERTVQRKVLKLVFVGNDKTLSHMARAYYELRKRQTTRAPLFQHVDLRMYFIPVSSNQKAAQNELVPVESKCGVCDVRVGELLGTFDSWYHTVVMLSVNNLLRVYPKIFSYGNTAEDSDKEPGNEKQYAKPKLLAPQEVIASTLLSYSRFAVSITNVNMYKVAMVTSTGDILTDIFSCRLQVGHDAYIKAAKAGRFGKLGKLVDLSDDSGPPPAYTKIEYSKWSIDGALIYTGKLEEAFYHTVSLTPMSLVKEHYRGRDEMHLFVLDNEKKPKAIRRGSSNRLSVLEEMELAGNSLNIGTMKMEVVRPTQGTFALLLDDSKIYTSIKSIEVVPCPAPETESMNQRRRNVTRRITEHHLMRLPVRTFWPVTQ